MSFSCGYLKLRIEKPSDADWLSCERDVERIVSEYGAPEDWQPHTKSKAQAEFDRVLEVLMDCFDVTILDGSD